MWVSGVHITMFNLSLVAPVGEQLGSDMHPISKSRPSALWRAPFGFGSFSAQAGHLPHPKRHRPFVPRLVAREAADFSKSV